MKFVKIIRRRRKSSIRSRIPSKARLHAMRRQESYMGFIRG